MGLAPRGAGGSLPRRRDLLGGGVRLLPLHRRAAAARRRAASSAARAHSAFWTAAPCAVQSTLLYKRPCRRRSRSSTSRPPGAIRPRDRITEIALLEVDGLRAHRAMVHAGQSRQADSRRRSRRSPASARRWSRRAALRRDRGRALPSASPAGCSSRTTRASTMASCAASSSAPASSTWRRRSAPCGSRAGSIRTARRGTTSTA